MGTLNEVFPKLLFRPYLFQKCMMIYEEGEGARPVFCVETLKYLLWNQFKLTSVFSLFSTLLNFMC